VIVYLFVDTLVAIVYRVSLYPTKSMILALTDIGSLQKFSKWNRTPKGSSNFSNVRVYLFVDTRVTIMYIVLSYPTKSMTLALTDIGSLQKFSKWNRTPKGSSNFSNVRVYLFVDTRVTIMYIVLSYPTKSMTLASTDIGSLQKFSKKWNRTPKRHASTSLTIFLPSYT
jgi:tryptophan-rich sensory protein